MGAAVSIGEGTRRRVSSNNPKRRESRPIKHGLPAVPVDFKSEMALTVRACQDRMSEREDENDEGEEVTASPGTASPSASVKPSRPTRQIREFSSEFLVDTALLTVPMSLVVSEGAQTSSVHDLTKAKLLAYYARRTDGNMRGGGMYTRARASSYSEVPQAMADAQTASASHHLRSGSLRAARTQRVYSEPPASMERDSSASLLASEGSKSTMGRRTAQATAPAGGRSYSVLDAKLSTKLMEMEDGKTPHGVPVFRPPVAAGISVH